MNLRNSLKLHGQGGRLVPGAEKVFHGGVKSLGKWILVLLVLLLLYLGWKWWSSGGEEDARLQRGADPALLFDRVWIDGIPEARTDYVQVFVALGATPVGVFQKASDYRVEAELYTYTRKDGKLTVYFPQTKKKKSFTYKIRTCDDLPPFDLCLELSKNPWGGPKHYYGWSEQSSVTRSELLGGSLKTEALPQTAP